MRYSIRTVTPAVEPLLSLEEAKKHLEVHHADDDALIAAMAASAQDYVERHTSRLLSPCVLEYACDGFGCGATPFTIPRDPITEILSVAYTDTSGADVELDGADWRWSESAADRLLPAFGTSWPVAAREPGSVRIQFEAGYEAGLCPPSLVAAVRLMLGTLYMQREDVVAGTVDTLPGGVKALCAPYRRLSI